MDDFKKYLKDHPRAMGAFLALIGAWLTDYGYFAPLRKIIAGAKEVTISENLCFLSILLFTTGLAFLFFPEKMKVWGEGLESRKGNYTKKDIFIIVLLILPGIAGYLYLKMEIEARGFTFR